MRKVSMLLVIALMIFAVASFASIKFEGGGVVQWTYPNFNINSSLWYLQFKGKEDGGYSFAVDLPFDFSGLRVATPTLSTALGNSTSFYVTVPLVENLSLLTGYEGYEETFLEEIFHGTQYYRNAPYWMLTNDSGQVRFGYEPASFAELQYKSSAFDANVQMTGLSATSVSAEAHIPMGPANLYVGAYPNFTSLYGGANASVGPTDLFGLVNYTSSKISYTVGAAANLGNNQLGLEYMGEKIFGWFDLGKNAEVNAEWKKLSLDKLEVEGYTTFSNNITGELQLAYSPSSSSPYSLTSTFFTKF